MSIILDAAFMREVTKLHKILGATDIVRVVSYNPIESSTNTGYIGYIPPNPLHFWLLSMYNVVNQLHWPDASNLTLLLVIITDGRLRGWFRTIRSRSESLRSTGQLNG